MLKRTWAIAAGVALLASMFTVGTAAAQDPPPAPAVPDVVQIDDPALDANTQSGDVVGPANVSNVGDLYKVWFSTAGDKINVNIQTRVAPPATAWGISLRVDASPNADGVKCLTFRGVVSGGAFLGPDRAKVIDNCNDGTSFYSNGLDGEMAIYDLEDGTGLTVLTFDRSYSPLLADGQTITAPVARSDAIAGESSGTPGFAGLRLDDTKPGTDYVIGSGGGGSDPVDPGTDPGDGDGGDGDGGDVDEPKKDKKDCKKAKGKKAKKKCKKKNKGNNGGGNGGGEEPKGESCPAYVPGEEGAEAETFVVKGEHTAEAPLEITIEQDMGGAGDLGLGFYDGAAHTFRNLQVDAEAADAGLYIRYEFPVYEDHDLYVNYADGSEAAHVGGFNMTPVSIFDGTGSGGHSEQGAEQIDGLRTADCAGYTIDFSNYLGEGGEYTVKVWLGEVQNEPAAPGGGR